MKRAATLKPSATLKRSSFARVGILASESAARLRKPRKPMKSSRPKMTPIRKSARGQECALQIPGVCNRDPETVVLCHSNYLKDGKGMGLKAPDTAAAFGCSACHDVLDGRAPRPDGISAEYVMYLFGAAISRTHEILRQKGLIE